VEQRSEEIVEHGRTVVGHVVAARRSRMLSLTHDLSHNRVTLSFSMQ
jgi:hypothetical protein